MLVAVCDFGTVTSRLLVAEVGDGGVRKIAKKTVITHLGEGLAASGRISDAAIARAVEAARGFVAEARRYLPEAAPAVKAVATSALRDAANSAEVIAALAAVGLDVEVIAGQAEAGLSFAGALSGFAPAELAGQRVLVVDIGGGSTELMAGHSPGGQPEPLRSASYDIGARRLTDRWLDDDPPSAQQLAAARQWATQQLAGWFQAGGPAAERIIAVAGTATTLVAIRDSLDPYDPEHVHGQFVSHAELRGMLSMLAGLPASRRRQVVGLEPERASVVVGGVLILDVVIGLAGLDGYTASESDILQGVALELWQGRAGSTM